MPRGRRGCCLAVRIQALAINRTFRLSIVYCEIDYPAIVPNGAVLGSSLSRFQHQKLKAAKAWATSRTTREEIHDRHFLQYNSH